MAKQAFAAASIFAEGGMEKDRFLVVEEGYFAGFATRELSDEEITFAIERLDFNDQPQKQADITRELNEFEVNMNFEYVAGFEQFITKLRSIGVKTAVVTSSNREKMDNVYAKHPEFKTYFDEVLTSEDFAKSKPDPDCYLKAAQKFGANETDKVIHIKDGLIGSIEDNRDHQRYKYHQDAHNNFFLPHGSLQ